MLDGDIDMHTNEVLHFFVGVTVLPSKWRHVSRITRCGGVVDLHAEAFEVGVCIRFRFG